MKLSQMPIMQKFKFNKKFYTKCQFIANGKCSKREYC